MCANLNAIRNGEVVTARINGHVVRGYWFTVDGCSWLIQPHRWIRITGPVQIIEKGGNAYVSR